ncbi:hypothetical protein HHJ77_08700 [Mobiluncus mulieris]|uniref:Uncharacterized protein n=1 Tax=Mobiluncus mulieris TaxID=2052 RepID=A0A2X1RID1_9ACTO|nr:hypothetical protein HMPREF0577_1719 [Mobiluncus mulieris ATCC 35243]NMX03999.1 hypothetical protein [Mobiluncus mulieris]SPX70668.1 Uncharacterised protein [Mobiluncus mulieris]
MISLKKTAFVSTLVLSLCFSQTCPISAQASPQLLSKYSSSQVTSKINNAEISKLLAVVKLITMSMGEVAYAAAGGSGVVIVAEFLPSFGSNGGYTYTVKPQ